MIIATVPKAGRKRAGEPDPMPQGPGVPTHSLCVLAKWCTLLVSHNIKTQSAHKLSSIRSFGRK